MQVVVFVNSQHHCFILRFFVGAGNFFFAGIAETKLDPVEFEKISAWNKRQPLTDRILRRTHSLYTHALFCSISLTLSLCYTPALSLFRRTLSRIFRTLLRARHQQVVERFPVHVFPTEKMTENATDRANVEPKSMRRRSIRCPVPRNRYQDRDKSANISFSVFFCVRVHTPPRSTFFSALLVHCPPSLSRSLSSSLTHPQSPSLFLAHSVDWPDVCVSVCRWCLLMLLSLSHSRSLPIFLSFASFLMITWSPSLAGFLFFLCSFAPSIIFSPRQVVTENEAPFPGIENEAEKNLGSKKKIGTKKSSRSWRPDDNLNSRSLSKTISAFGNSLNKKLNQRLPVKTNEEPNSEDQRTSTSMEVRIILILIEILTLFMYSFILTL